MAAAGECDTRTKTVSRTQYASSFGDLGRATFDLSNKPEKVGLVAALISSGVSNPATIASDCGSGGGAGGQDTCLVLHTYATGVTRPREPLLHLSISSIIDQAVVDDGDGGCSKLWKLTVLMEHFFDTEQVILLLRPRFHSDLEYTYQLSQSLADILGRRDTSAYPDKIDSVTGSGSADGAAHEIIESSTGRSAAFATKEPEVKGGEESMAEEGEWREPDSPYAQRPSRRKRQRTHALAALPARTFYSHRSGDLLSRLQSWLSQQYQLQQRPLPAGAPCSPPSSHPSAYRVFPKQAHAFAFHDQLAGLSPLGSENEAFSRNREQEHERPEQKERHVQALSSPLRLWAFQAASDGRRGFAVCSLVPLFMDMYLRSMPPHARHVYEIIREGYPCRLYFDVEFEKEDNPGLDGDALLNMFLDVVARKLHEVFGLSCPQSCFLQLDSSTPTRFSRHVITHLPSGQLFRSTIHVARFLHRLLHDVLQTEEGQRLWVKKRGAQLASASSIPPQTALGQTGESGAPDPGSEVDVDMDQAEVWSGDAPGDCPAINPCSTSSTGTASRDALDSMASHLDVERPEAREAPADAEASVGEGGFRDVLFVDTSVYSRNRSFRLLGSRKHGKGTPCFTLHNARAFESQPLCPRGCPPSSALMGHEQDEEAHWLLASLVVPYVPCQHHTDTTASPLPLLYVPLDEAQHRLTPGPCSSHLLPSSATCPPPPPGPPLSLSSISAEGGRPSPFPLVDAFILSLVTQGGVQGIIRSWHYAFGGPADAQQQKGEEGKRSLLTFQIGNNRWCANIGRAHRSNHIMMVADLRRGVVYQKCWDPECRQYRSGPIYLPAGVAPDPDAVEQVEFDAALAQHISQNPQDYP